MRSTTTVHEHRMRRCGVALAVTVAVAVGLLSGSTALAYGPSPFLHRQQAQEAGTLSVSRIPHTGGLTQGQIARRAERHQLAINRAASESPAPAVVTTSTDEGETLPIVLSAVALLVALGSAGALAVGVARIRSSAQPSA